MRVRLRIDQAGKAVAGAAPDAPALLRVPVIQHDAHRQRKRVQPEFLEIALEFGDTCLVRDGWK